MLEALNEFDRGLLDGFGTPVAFDSLRQGKSAWPPPVAGVYAVVLAPRMEPKFVVRGTGGIRKGKDPNVNVEELRRKWVPGAGVLYVGKAGGPGENATLDERLRAYSSYGRGAKVAHSGGRYIWQIEGAGSLGVCWKPTPNEIPCEVESCLIGDFVHHYRRLPFANLCT